MIGQPDKFEVLTELKPFEVITIVLYSSYTGLQYILFQQQELAQMSHSFWSWSSTVCVWFLIH